MGVKTLDRPITFFSTSQRVLKVGITALELLPDLLGGKLTPEQLTSAMGMLKGPLIKIIQMLASIPNLLPFEYVKVLQSLQSQVPPMGPLFVERRLKSELGPHWADHFQNFNLRPLAAASLGQVHQATALDGTPLAVKLQYPDMDTAVAGDLAQFKMSLSIYKGLKGALDPEEFLTEIKHRLEEEVNYLQEAHSLERMHLATAGVAHLEVPRVYLKTRRLLGMTWAEGSSILNVLDHSLELREQWAQTLFRGWYTPLYQYGLLHGDPHLGNYLLNTNGNVAMLDLGCVRQYESPFLEASIRLYRALLTGREVPEALEAWGFRGIVKDHLPLLERWARFLYGPVLKDRSLKVKELNSPQQGQALAQTLHNEIGRVGRLTIPRTFVFMDRAAVGLGSAFMHLDVALNWHHLFEETISLFDPNVVDQFALNAFFSASPLFETDEVRS